MFLAEACCLTQDLTSVCVTPLSDQEDLVAFCERHRFHRAQEYLLPHVLKRLLASVSPTEILFALDHFQIRFAFFMAGEVPVAIGPFCTEFFSLTDCTILLRQRGITLPPHDFLVWRGTIPVRPESDILHFVYALASNLELDQPLETVRRVGYDNVVVEINEAAAHKTYAQLIQERYRTEMKFMDHIRQGNSTAAVDSWRYLHNSVSYMKNLGQPLETARIAAAITRTTMRVAAMEAGLLAVLNDQISGQSARNIREATSIDAIDQEHVRLIREYCRVIRRQKDSGHSSLVLSALYYIERHYAEPIKVSDLAAELDVSPNYLTAQFSKEIGVPPSTYLMETRMQHAAELLVSNASPIQEISAQVGISDANYFAKLFKRKYGETPASYRKKHKI